MPAVELVETLDFDKLNHRVGAHHRVGP